MDGKLTPFEAKRQSFENDWKTAAACNRASLPGKPIYHLPRQVAQVQ
jgi:hypothetical protein